MKVWKRIAISTVGGKYVRNDFDRYSNTVIDNSNTAMLENTGYNV